MAGIEQVLRIAKEYPVFPCKPDKTPLVRWKESATQDPERIREWWAQYPGALVAMPTGQGSTVVLDIDTKDGTSAQVRWRALTAGRELPPTLIYETRSGGYHCHFVTSDALRNTAGSLGPFVDTRGDGGYVVRWDAEGAKVVCPEPPAPLPDWLRSAWAGAHRPTDSRRQFTVDGAIPEGGRNHYLASIAGAMRRRGASGDAIEAALMAQNKARCNPALLDDEVRRIAASISRYEPDPESAGAADIDRGSIDEKLAWALVGAAEKIEDDEHRQHELLAVIAPQAATSERISEVDRRKLLRAIAKLAGTTYGALKADLAKFKAVLADKDFNHLEAAREVVRALGEGNVISHQSFVWIWRRHGVWARADDREVKQKIHEVAGSNELTRAVADSVLDLFKTETWIRDHQFDADTRGINCQNGELHWSETTGWALKPHNREAYRTTQIPVRYDPKATAPRFEEFLREVFEEDPDGEDKALAVIQMIGYSLLSSCQFERFVILVGSGANGKSVLLHVVIKLLGTSNVSAVQPCQFENRFQRAHLHGKLANIVVEIAEGAEIADAALKSIVSGELTTAEHKHKPPFDFTPFATCWFGTNHMPHTRDFSDAMFRRAMVLQFNRKFEGANCDEHLKEKLESELPGILNLALKGLARLLSDHGFIEPASCVQAKQDWRLQCDQVARFVEDRCISAPQTFVPTSTVYTDYREWANDEGVIRPLGKNAVSARLKGLGFEPGHDPTKTQRVIWGLRLR